MEFNCIIFCFSEYYLSIDFILASYQARTTFRTARKKLYIQINPPIASQISSISCLYWLYLGQDRKPSSIFENASLIKSS